MDILEEINFGGTTILLVTHDAKVASRADRIIYLEDGKIKDEFRQKKGSESNIKEWLAKMGFNGIIFLWKNDFLMKTQ